MNRMPKHIAELNIGRLLYPQDDPRVAPFIDNLDLVNGLAERAPGFVWRLQGENGDATGIQGFDDPELILNLSVWDSAEALARFAFGTIPKRFFARRALRFLGRARATRSGRRMADAAKHLHGGLAVDGPGIQLQRVHQARQSLLA